ncbi:MAG TPA: pitrilysin family protein [Rubrivivax sp.]
MSKAALPPTDTFVDTLPNGVRVLVLPEPRLHTAQVSVFVRTGSAHESRALNGVSHFVEHMLFKGTHTRDVHRINLDAERLGAEVNAHTDKDHTAFYMRGRAAHAPAFVHMLADIVQNATFPEAEIEREREVLLNEHSEVDDDPMTAAYTLFDHACYGLHAAAQPVIGSRRNIERLSRADLAAYFERQYTGANVVVAVAGQVDADSMLGELRGAFASLPPGAPNAVEAPVWGGGIRSRRLAGSGQTHFVLGFPIPALADDDGTGEVAAALLGEGMSSPLMSELRERRGLVYYAACAADVLDCCGQFAIEASFAPGKLDEVLREVAQLLAAQAVAIDPVDLERARNQIVVRGLRTLERPARRLEEAALDLFARGRLRSAAERIAGLEAIDADAVRRRFELMLAAPVSLAITGSVGRAVSERARTALEALNVSAG